MASLVLLLSLFVRPKIKSHASNVIAASSDTIEDASSLHGWAKHSESNGCDNELEEIMGEKILQEPRVCIDLI